MRKAIILCFLIGLTSMVFSQTYQLNFESSNPQQQIDSVSITNLGDGSQKTIIGSAQLNLEVITSLSNEQFSSMRVFPNPVMSNCTVDFELSASGLTTIALIDESGKQIASESTIFDLGKHSFMIENIKAGTYILLVSNEKTSLSQQIISKSASNGMVNIVINKEEANLSTASLRLKADGASNTMSIKAGANLRFVAYSNKLTATQTAVITSNRTITFVFPTLPVIETSPAGSVTSTSAIISSAMTTAASEEIIEFGVCWSTSENPTTADNKKTVTGSANSFTVGLSGLAENTRYYVRPYAITASGTTYGSEINFTTLSSLRIPTVSINNAASITDVSASVSANITSNGGSAITSAGFCYGTNQNPTITDTKINVNNTSGAFSANLSGLIESKTYYVRSFAINNIGIAYSPEISFITNKTIGVPTVSLNDLTDITETGLMVNIELMSNGGSNVTKLGVCLSKSTMPTVNDIYVPAAITSINQAIAITGLEPNTQYYVRAYSINSKYSAYSNRQATFVTLAKPAITTIEASNIAPTSATLGGTITSLGNPAATTTGICWATTPAPTTANNIIAASSVSNFTTQISGLTALTKYYVRAYITNKLGTQYGSEVSFTTTNGVAVPTLTTTAGSNITYTTITSGGKVTNNGGSEITAQGVCWATTTNPTIANSITTESVALTSFASTLTGLTEGTLYYVRAYATNSAGTAYGNQLSIRARTGTYPSLSNIKASDTTATSFTIKGISVNNNGSPVTEYGVYYSTKYTSPWGSDGAVTIMGEASTFDVVLTNLKSNTLYYVRAYAKNKYGAGGVTVIQVKTNFQEATALPIMADNSSITDIAGNTANLTSKLTSTGNGSISQMGYCLSKQASPDITDTVISFTPDTASFTKLITGLQGSTTYYVRSFATNSMGTAYSNEVTFKTLPVVLATVTTGAINVSTATITSSGTITNNGGGLIIERGICWSTASKPTTTDNSKSSTSTANTYNIDITKFQPNVTYYVRAYCINSAGIAYGNEVTFIKTMTIGQQHNGGILAYIYKNGDPGYIAGETHGIIVSSSDLSSSTKWEVSGNVVVGSTSAALGAGAANTNRIVSALGSGSYAASVCADYSNGGYSDWYLPSQNELKVICTNYKAIGNLSETHYWSSTEDTGRDAFCEWISTSTGSESWYATYKSTAYSIRAIRYF